MAVVFDWMTVFTSVNDQSACGVTRYHGFGLVTSFGFVCSVISFHYSKVLVWCFWKVYHDTISVQAASEIVQGSQTLCGVKK